MYEELVKRLRTEANEWCNICCYKQGDCICMAPDDRKKDCDIYSKLQAADAIEELSKQRSDDGDWWAKARELEKMLEMPRWIPVTERLPEKNGKYLCNIKRFGQYAGMQYYYVDVLAFQEDCFFEDGIGTKRVTHWMPLPEPPKEENHGREV